MTTKLGEKNEQFVFKLNLTPNYLDDKATLNTEHKLDRLHKNIKVYLIFEYCSAITSKTIWHILSQWSIIPQKTIN